MKTKFAIKLRELRVRSKATQEAVANALGINRSTYAKYETGENEPDHLMTQKLASYFNVTTDYLLNHEPNTDRLSDIELSPKEERDIAEEIERILNGLDNEGMAYYGENQDEDDEEAKELLRLSLEQSLRLAKRAAKKKFTPKKYRK